MLPQDLAAKEIVLRMLEKDLFSQWLGIELLEVKAGYSKIKMRLRREMMNGFGIAHGGIIFALADSAFAFACNSEGKITLALDVSISFPKAGREQEDLIAEAKQVNKTRRTGLYLVEIKNTAGELAALFKGTCYQTEKTL